jgi:peptidoglycan hydrolase-like protein with peptidoglycan-binding domain
MAVSSASSASRSSSARSSSARSSSARSSSGSASRSSNSNNSPDTSGKPSKYIAAPDTKKAAESPRNSLQWGHGGQSVADMQRELNKSGANLAVDGKFGPKTDAAVRAYQANHGLKVDGKAGMQTLGSLYNDGRGSDAYAGKSAGAAPKAPTAAQQAARPAGTAKAADVQRPMSAKGPRTKPPAGSSPTAANPGGTPQQHAVDKAAAQQAASQPNRPKAGLSDPKQAATTKPVDPQSRPGQPANKTATFDKVSKTGRRNQMVTGRITVNGNTYDFRSGGHGRGNLPKGDYKITPHRYSRSDASMSVGGVGYSYAVSDKYDARVGGTRSLLRIHPDGRGPGTMGCIGIVGDANVQRQFRADMEAELKRNGGSFNLQVG